MRRPPEIYGTSGAGNFSEFLPLRAVILLPIDRNRTECREIRRIAASFINLVFAMLLTTGLLDLEGWNL